MLWDLVAATPDRPALDDFERIVTWAELGDRATRLGHLLRDGLGVAPGEHVAMVMGNRVECIELVLASVLSGVWITPVNWHLTDSEAAYVLADADAKAVFTDPGHETLARGAAGDRPVVLAGAPLDEALRSCSTVAFDLDDPSGGTMFYTSGTTGRPKGVKRAVQPTVAAQLAGMAGAGRLLGLDGGGAHLVTGPLYHAAPLGFAMMDAQNGAPLVLMGRFDAAETLELISQRRVRNTHLVPTMFVRLLRLSDDIRYGFDPSSLHVVLHGAAPVSRPVKERMIEWWGPVLVEYWGASEGGVVTLVNSEEWLEHPGTVGRPVRTHEVAVTDEAGTPLAPGEVGVLWCRNLNTDQVFTYHNDPDKTAAAFAAPGTYTIGDMGWVDDDGYVYLADRVSNMIISGGVNIYPAEIEHVLIEHPAVADVAVFGVPDDEWGEQVKAAVSLVDGYEPSAELTAAILAFAREHLAGFKVPRTVDFEDELPRLPTGKILTRVLREKYWAGRGRSI